MKRFALILAALLTLVAVSCSGSSAAEAQKGYVVQVFTGGWHQDNYTPRQIIDRLEEVTAEIPVSKVIIGWSLNREPYEEVGEYLRGKGIEMYLWMPVFSEIGELAECDPAVDIWGAQPSSYALQEGENFTFYCPSSAKNIAAFEKIYEDNFAGLGFDGIFLDKIRTQSFVGGVSGVMTCCCDECAKWYAAHGVDLADVREALEKDGDDFFSAGNPVAEKFFDAKCQLIAESVGKISGWCHAKGMKVGMDLYAPLMSRFVGQDYNLLPQHADFVKPMLYRRTEAPAGTSFEYAMFRSAAPAANGWGEIAMDVDFLRGQFEAASVAACPVYPGIEVNYREDIARTDADYVRESMTAVREAGCPGAVLSWDIMLAPDSNVSAVTQTDIRAEMFANPVLMTGTDRVYSFDLPALTPAPKGWTPFYISHYGRHGSRSAWQDDMYTDIEEMLEKAEEQDNLTEYGKSFKERFDKYCPLVSERVGELTPKGWKQHHDIAAKMMADFPEVFAQDPDVFAISSPSMRVVMSMASFCLSLQAGNPKMNIVEEQSPVHLHAVLPQDHNNPRRVKVKAEKVPFDKDEMDFYHERVNDDEILGHLFKNVDKAVAKNKRSHEVYYLYFFVSGVQSVDTDLDFTDLFTPEQYYALWEYDNYQFFLDAWPERRGYLPVVEDIVAKADSHIASGKAGVDLRFGHDYTIFPLTMLVGVDGFNRTPSSAEDVKNCMQIYRICMAANLQFIFYGNPASEDTLFKVLFDGTEATLPISPVCGPYYSWSAYKAWLSETWGLDK